MDKQPYKVDALEPGRDYTYVHMAPELFAHRPIMFAKILARDSTQSDRSKGYAFESFKATEQYSLRRYYPLPGTALYEGFRRRTPSRHIKFGLSFLQKLDRGNVQMNSPVGELPSITLLEEPTAWLRVSGVTEEFCKRAKIDSTDRNRVYARLHPVSPAERFFEARIEFFNGATFLLSDVSDSWGMVGNHWNLKLKLGPLTEDDRAYFEGLGEFDYATEVLDVALPTPEALPVQLPSAKPFPLPRPAVPLLQQQPAVEAIQLSLFEDLQGK